MRRARYKSSDAAFYHIFTRLAGSPRYFPLQRRQACQKLLQTIRSYVDVYCCELVGYEIMGNHYHFIVFIEKYRSLTRDELAQRARRLYGHRYELKTANWAPELWERFNHKLFDVSSLMQQINGEYAKWFNRRFARRGHLWADRYKNPELLDREALQECLLYIELNAVRAGLVKRPEQWKASSAWARFHRCDQDLMPLERIFPGTSAKEAFASYRTWLYRRGAIAESRDQHKNKRAKAQDIHTVVFSSRLRFFTDGLAVGGREKVSALLDQFRAQGTYRYRKKPIPQLSGFLFTLREQRSNALG